MEHLLPCSVSTGSIQQVITALVCSVNVCQMEAAAAAYAVAAVAAAAACTVMVAREKEQKETAFHFWSEPYFQNH